MIITTVYAIAVLFFCLTFYYTKVVSTCKQVVTTANQAIVTLSDKTLDDFAKEKAIQQSALNMLKHCAVLFSKIIAIFSITALPIALSHYLNVATVNDIGLFAMRWDVLILTTAIAILPVMFIRKKHTSESASSKKTYSKTDRLIHNLAFHSTILQDILGDIENSLFPKVWAKTKVEKPVFITSLPRAGTTIILEALNKLPELATHTYRDMPFILTPVLWEKTSRVFYNKGTHRERAHGDGLSISEDSPEAFEEIFWKKYYPQQYTSDGIRLWQTDEPLDNDFIDFFHLHIKKIISLRLASSGQAKRLETGRYLSKNNANIARITTIQSIFPDAFIIVPLRNPIEHAISLWHQHQRFSQQHAEDDFSREYMADIGHFEFGALHLPIQFPKTQELTNGLTPESLDYWLAYWIAAFEYLSEQPHINFLCYESLCQSGSEGLSILCNHLKLSASEDDINQAASVFHAPPQNRGSKYSVANELSSRAIALHSSLQEKNLLSRTLI